MSAKERIRHEAVAEAVASARIEGYDIDEQTENLCIMLAEGMISMEEYIEQVLKMSEAVLA